MFIPLFLSSLAFAGETGVLVSNFEAQNEKASTLAEKLPTALLERLAKDSTIKGMALQDAAPVHKTTAETYMLTCPYGEYAGCTTQIALVNEVPFAISGKVSALEEVLRVSVVFIDVTEGAPVTTITLDVTEGGEQGFVEAVLLTLKSVIKGEITAGEDMREEEVEEEQVTEEEKDELDMYTRKSGGASSVEKRNEIELERRTLTKEQVEEMIEEEGSKEWEYVDMGPWEYMRYINSGMRLSKWRKLMKGRQGQLLFRGGVGAVSGPSHGQYYGRWARSSIDLSTIETYAWQAVETGGGVSFEGYLGIGILPQLDFGVVGGTTTGRFIIDLHATTIGQNDVASKPDSLPNSVGYVGFEGAYAPMLIQRFKPVIAVAGTMHFGTKATEYVENFPDDLPDIEASTITMLSVKPGMEMRLTDSIDLWFRLPVSFLLSVTNSPELRQSGGGALEENNRALPDGHSSFSSGLFVGFQTRIGPFGGRKTGLDIYE